MKISPKFLAITLAISSFSILNAQTQQFTTAGGDTFTVPTSCLTIKVECIGGGGGGGRVTPSNIFDDDAAGGGGGGAYAMSIVPVTGGNTYNVYVGNGGNNTGSSTQGEDSWWETNVVLAEGGMTRTGNDQENGVPGGQAANSIGDVTYNGGNGGNGNEGDADGGGGGSAAGSTGPGLNGVTVTGGGPTTLYGGFGGNGGDDGDYGDPGGMYGGGGGGSSAQGSQDRNGGAGHSGLVMVSWVEVTGFTPTTLCAGAQDDIIITGSNFTNVDSVTVNGIPVTYTVDSGVQITIVNLGSATTGDIIVYSDHGSAITSAPLTITDNSVNVTVDNSGTVLTANYTGGSGETYQWIDCINNNDPISGAVDSTFTASSNGLYAVIVSENGCDIQSSCFTVASVGLKEEVSNDFDIYPNPAVETITISAGNAIMDQLRIVNLNAQTVFEDIPNSSTTEINVKDLPSGVYLIEVISNQIVITKKLIKSN